MDPGQESRELHCLSVMTEARLAFYQQLLNHAERYLSEKISNVDDREQELERLIPIINSDNCYQIAKFFYLVQELNLTAPGRLPLLLERHNQDMRKLIEQKNRRHLRLQGLDHTPVAESRWLPTAIKRISQAQFSRHQIHKILSLNGQNCERIRLDQSDLSKLMFPIMSPESCRTLVKELNASGLLALELTDEFASYKQIFVQSNGVLEKAFRDHLTEMANQLVSL